MRKTKLKKVSKKKTNEWYRKEAVKIAKLIAKHRDGYRCVTCGRSAEQGYQIHGSHIYPESKYHSLSCLPINIMAQCFRCHSLWHEHPKGQGWFDRKYPTRKQELDDIEELSSKSMIKPDYAKKLEELKEEYFNLIN